MRSAITFRDWTALSSIIYEAEIVKRGMDSITVQPLVADEAFMTHMEAMFVPFHMEYGSLICY